MCPLPARLKSFLAKQAVNLLAACVGLVLALTLPLSGLGWNITAASSGTDRESPSAFSYPPRPPQFLASPTLLKATPDKIDLGSVPPSSRTEATFRLTNRTDQVVLVEQLRTSCECLHVELSNPALGPGATVEGRVVLDLSTDPRFVGNLAIDLEGQTNDGQLAFELVVNVRIKVSAADSRRLRMTRLAVERIVIARRDRRDARSASWRTSA